MVEDNSYLNPMAMWHVPRDDPGLKAIDRLKKGLNELANMPKSTQDIEHFRTMQRAATMNAHSKRADKVRDMLAEHHTFLKTMK
jgi:hypothetical protein